MARYDVTTAAARLEFDTVLGQYHSAVQIDANHFIDFWQGNGSDGFAQVFAVNTSTWAVTTAAASLEFDTQQGDYNAALKVDTNHFLNLWVGSNTVDMFAQVMAVNTSTWAVTTAASRLSLDAGTISWISSVIIDANHALAFWGGNDTTDGIVQVLTVNTSTWAVTTAAASLTIENSTLNLQGHVAAIDANHFLAVWCGAADDGFAQVLTVNTSTWAVTTAAASLEYDTQSGFFPKFWKIDANHFLVTWQGASGDGFAQVLQVNTTTWVVTTAAARIEFDTQDSGHHAIAQIDSTHYLITRAGVGADGFTQVLTVNTSTWVVTTAAGVLEFDTVNGQFHSLVRIDTSHYINFWAGDGSDGFVQVLTVDVPPDVQTLADDFNNNSIDAGKWSNWGGGNVVETNQRIEVTGTTTNGNYFGMDSVNRYRVVDTAISIRLVDAGANHANRAVIPIQFGPDANNQAYWQYVNGNLQCWTAVASSYTQRGSNLAHTASTPMYLRIREASGTVYWEYSTDGTSWTTQASLATPFDFSDILVTTCMIGNNGATASASFAYFDNFNVIPGPAISTLTDNFDDNSLDSGLWDSATVGAGAVNETGGQLVLDMPPGADSNAEATVTSKDLYSLSGDSLSIVVEEAGDTSQTTRTCDFYAYIDSSNWVRFAREGTLLYLEVCVNGSRSAIASPTYDPSDHYRWRIRESGGTVYWDVAPESDPASFSNLASTAYAGPSLESVKVRINSNIWGSVTDAGDFIVDNLNLDPSVSQDAQVDAPTQTATSSIPSATVSAEKSPEIAAPAQTATSSLPSPSVSSDELVEVEPDTQTAAAGVQAPSVSTEIGAEVAPDTQSAPVSVPTPSVETQKSPEIAAPPQTAAASLPTPAAASQEHVEVEAGAQSASSSLPTPAVSSDEAVGVAAEAQTATTGVPSPSIETGSENVVEGPTQTAKTSAPQPTVTSDEQVEVAAPTQTAAAGVQAPSVTSDEQAEVAPAPLSASATSRTPTVTSDQHVVVSAEPLTANAELESPAVSSQEQVEVAVPAQVATIDQPTPAVQTQEGAAVLAPEQSATVGVQITQITAEEGIGPDPFATRPVKTVLGGFSRSTAVGGADAEAPLPKTQRVTVLSRKLLSTALRGGN